MSYSKIILQDSADIVWPLDDIGQSSSVSKAVQFMDSNQYCFSASINVNNTTVINTPIIFGGGTALALTSSAVCLSIPAINKFSELSQNKNSCVEFWFKPSNFSSIEQTILKKRNFDNIGLFVKDNYLIFRYGNSASYSEVSVDLIADNEPHHIVLNLNTSTLSMIVDGVSYASPIIDANILSSDPSHSDNDYIDFYGPVSNNWIVDGIAYYSNNISELDAKRHYVYGLGKSIGEDVFYHRGGEFYNLSNIDTEKLLRLYWTYPKEWFRLEINDLEHKNDGLQPLYFSDPEWYSYDSYVDKSSDSISFTATSGSVTSAAYIDVKQLFKKINYGEYPLFIKIKLDGELPAEGYSQRIMTYGQQPTNEITTFDLYNNSGSYKILIQAGGYSTEFNLENASSQPDVYLGMEFTNKSLFYLSQSGSATQTASFNFYDSDGYGSDPLSRYFPPLSDYVLRIGSKLTYSSNDFSLNLSSVNQFTGTFKKLLIHEKDLSASVDYSYLEGYNKSRYAIAYDTSLDRFKTFTYGSGEFNIHGLEFGKFINDTDQRIGANVINIGYPDISSSSQVQVFVTHVDYDENELYPKTLLSQTNYLDFINNINVASTYLKFNIEIRAEDSSYYPPKIKYFNMETYKGDSQVVLRNDAGSKYTLYQSSSSAIFLPEIKRTPTMFMSDTSGIKLQNSIVDFTEDIAPAPLNPNTIDGLVAWYDARFINGFGVTQPSDDSIINNWLDLSGNNYNLIQADSASAPTFRIQSLNILTNNQGNGAENGLINNIIGINCSASPSPDGAVSGKRGIKVTPDNTSVDSYVELGRNTASYTVYPDLEYSVLGSIKLITPQTASYLHEDARKIAVYIDSGSGLTLTASTTTASNVTGTYNLYAEFTAPSTVLDASIRLYNGSFSEADVVYWDNIALYPKQSGSYINSWIQPLTLNNDMPVVKFNGFSSLQSSASADVVMSRYVVSRDMSSANPVFTLTITSGSYSLSEVSFGSATEDIAAYVLYNRILSNDESALVEDWLSETFNLDQ